MSKKSDKWESFKKELLASEKYWMLVLKSMKNKIESKKYLD